MTVFPQEMLIWQRFSANVSGNVSTNILREKRRDSFDPQRENLLGENDSICMVNLLGISRVIVFFLLHD